MGFEAYIYVMAIVQGATEFLPVSSTGHEALAWEVLEARGRYTPANESERILIEIAVHVGTLFAVILYFLRDVIDMAVGAWKLVRFKSDPRGHLLAQVAIASVPLVPAGFLAGTFIMQNRYNLELLAFTSITFGILLWAADRFSWSIRKAKHLGLGGAFLVGLMQCLALIPGVSRSGIVITAGRLLALERSEAARFSMLLAIPAIAGAGLAAGISLASQPELQLELGLPMFVAGALAFFIALPTFPLLMRLATQASFAVFCIYRILFGLLIIILLAFGVLGEPSPVAV